MNESEQAQARKKIGEMTNTPWGYDVGVWLNNCETLLEIVDSQAQKIADQAMQIEKLAGLNHVAEAQIERQAMQIAKQAKEIERLKAANDAAEKARINSSLNEYYRKSL